MSTDRPISKEPIERLAYSIKEAAASLGVSHGHVINLIQRKQLPAKKLGRRVIILASDMHAFLSALPDGDRGTSQTSFASIRPR